MSDTPPGAPEAPPPSREPASSLLAEAAAGPTESSVPPSEPPVSAPAPTTVPVPPASSAPPDTAAVETGSAAPLGPAGAPADEQAAPSTAPAEEGQAVQVPSEPSAPPAGEAEGEGGDGKRDQRLIVRYGMMSYTGLFRHNLKTLPPPGTKVVVRTDRGVELGEVVACVCRESCRGGITPERLEDVLNANGPEFPFRREGKVLRVANHQDVIDQRHLSGSAKEEMAFCRQQVQQIGLKLKLVAVEHLLGGERIVFYFSSESRVDFRELVRRLAAQYRTRIEMRQVGARDETRLVGGYERCGRQCCCQVFIKDLKPVSMRMAKMQKATLDPSKISGRCGRLMCCLRYEDAGYEELRAKLPRRNTWVRTAGEMGRVVDTQILTQLVRLEKVDATQVVVSNEDILERDLKPPKPAELPPSTFRAAPPVAPPLPVSTETPADIPAQGAEDAGLAEAAPAEVEPVAEAPTPAAAPSSLPPVPPGESRRKRRRGRRRPPRGDGRQPQGAAPAPVSGQPVPNGSPPAPGSPPPASGGSQTESGPAGEGGRRSDGPPRRRRRHRRRR